MAALEQPVTAGEIYKEFKLNSLVLRKDALVAIQRTLRGARAGANQHELLRGLIDNVQAHIERGGGASSIVDEDCITAVVAEKTKNKQDVSAERFQVFSAFRMPHYEYDSARKAFHVSSKPRSLHAQADSKINMYRERLILAQQRMSRHPSFASGATKAALPGVPSAAARGHLRLTAIESLGGHHGDSVLILAMLSCPEEGRYELEDLHSRVSLAFDADCVVPVGLLTETCVVVVEGVFDRDGDGGAGQVRATLVGQPFLEDRADACAAMGVVDPSRSLTTPAQFAQALAMEQAARRAFIVFASDVHLDDPSVLRNLRVMLRTWVEFGALPTALILQGNFLSHPFGAGASDKDDLCRGLDDLAALLADFPALSSTPCVLVPGPADPGAGRVLPRPGLPASFCERLKARTPQVVLASNPCRLRFHTQELVVFREEVSARLGKHAVKTSLPEPFDFDDTQHRTGGGDVEHPDAGAGGRGGQDEGGEGSDAEDVSLAKEEEEEGGGSEVTKAALHTMLHQMHLLPLPLRVQPVHWDYDASLRLYPAPDVLVVGEGCGQYHYTVGGTSCFNPGSFPHGGKFVVYYPAKRRLEMSQV